MSFAEGDTKLGTQVYYAVVGPTPDGVVDHAFTIILPSDSRSVVITAGNDAAHKGRARRAAELRSGRHAVNVSSSLNTLTGSAGSTGTSIGFSG